MSDACSRHLGRVQDYINRLEERSEGLRAALADVAAALGYGEGETLRPEELADRVSELRDVVERQAATLSRKCDADSWRRIEDDASRSACAYFGSHERCEDCPAGAPYYPGSCRSKMTRDIVRRAKALAGEGNE